MTGPFPFSSSPTKAPTPSDALLCEQTLINVPIAHADTGARRRLAQKRAVEQSAPRPSIPLPARAELTRVVGGDGVTRWFDAAANEVARASTADEDRATIERLNVELTPKPARLSWAMLFAALTVLGAVALRSCLH